MLAFSEDHAAIKGKSKVVPVLN